MSLALAARGLKLILTARREAVLAEVKEACLAAGAPEVHTYRLDMARPDDIDAVALQVLAEHPQIDILINNAGISQRSLIRDTQMEVYRRLIEVDYLGPVQLTKALLPQMIDRKTGHIVVISSLVGKFATPLRSGYAAAKHALHGFFDTLRMEHQEDGLQVTIICPGFIKTEISLNALSADGSRQNKMDRAQAAGMEPTEFARQALIAIEKGRPEVLIGGKEKLGVLLHRLFPGAFKNYLRKAPVT